MRILAVLSLVALVLALQLPARANDRTCDASADANTATVGCLESGAGTAAFIAAHPEHTYEVRIACGLGGTARCNQGDPCTVDGHDGYLYDVYEDGATEPLPWQACLTNEEAVRLGVLGPGFVERAFRRLTWPASDLVIQPPHGKTLVNFDTNFYTTNTRPTTQTVTLLGQRVTVQATPITYRWHFGADEPDLTTTDPGAAYPDLRVVHRYLRAGTVAPSVDTTYTGRYRVNAGAWQTIPDTLTVPGTPVTLQVLTATPHLVGY